MALMVDYNAMWDTYILAMPRASLKTAAMGTVEMKCHTCPSSIQFPMISILTLSGRIQKKKTKQKKNMYILHQLKMVILITANKQPTNVKQFYKNRCIQW